MVAGVDKTLAILLGAAEFPKYPNLTGGGAFRSSVVGFSNCLRQQFGDAWFKTHLLDLFNSEARLDEQLRQIAQHFEDHRQAEKLILFYVGHGGFIESKRHEYYLALRSTEKDFEHVTGLEVASLAATVDRFFPGRQVYIFLDCCFAGRAVEKFQSGVKSMIDEQVSSIFPDAGTSILCASSQRAPAISEGTGSRTMFSECLLDVLEIGVAGGGKYLTLRDIHEAVARLVGERFGMRGVRPEIHSPRQLGSDVANLPLFQNRAHSLAGDESPIFEGNSEPPKMRQLTVVAVDPYFGRRRQPVVTQAAVPMESLGPGPSGTRVEIVDYDSSTRTLYKPFKYPRGTSEEAVDPFRKPGIRTILDDPGFHAQNVYAIAMQTLTRFEFALGRHVSWSGGHQLKIAPHAFSHTNAFYAPADEAILFGYFVGRSGTIFSCLSHDVIAHETCHAILDGLRLLPYRDPSSPDEAAFHEGFADAVALLSIFSVPEVTRAVLNSSGSGRHRFNVTELRAALFVGLAESMSYELSMVRGEALIRAAALKPSRTYLKQTKLPDTLWRGEILVAALMNTFLEVLAGRIRTLGRGRILLTPARIATEAASVAKYLLILVIRALDYLPPVHLQFSDFLSAALTADQAARPDDSEFQYRDGMRRAFGAFGIRPSSRGEGGLWIQERPEDYSYERVQLWLLSRDRHEVFRFIWENRAALRIKSGFDIDVVSLCSCARNAPEPGGVLVRETVADCLQSLRIAAGELKRLGIQKPPGMPEETNVTLRAGTRLVFDEFGHLKYSIGNRLEDATRQTNRLAYLWENGHFLRTPMTRRAFGRGIQLGVRRQVPIQPEW